MVQGFVICVLGTLLFFNFLSFELFLQHWCIAVAIYQFCKAFIKSKHDAESFNFGGNLKHIATLFYDMGASSPSRVRLCFFGAITMQFLTLLF